MIVITINDRQQTIHLDHPHRSAGQRGISVALNLCQPPVMAYRSDLRQPAPMDPSSQLAPGPSSSSGPRMTPSPAPALPSLSPTTGNAMQPGSMAPPPVPTGQTTPGGGAGQLGAERGPDYVYFERKPAQFGQDIVQKATAAKMRLELYYKEAVQGVVDRKERCVMRARRGQRGSSGHLARRRRTKLEKSLHADQATPLNLKTRQLEALGRRESK